jgi:hypothetical protein
MIATHLLWCGCFVEELMNKALTNYGKMLMNLFILIGEKEDNFCGFAIHF